MTFDVNIYRVTAAKLITRRASEKSISMSRLVQLLLSLIKYILAVKFLSFLSFRLALAAALALPRLPEFSFNRKRNSFLHFGQGMICESVETRQGEKCEAQTTQSQQIFRVFFLLLCFSADNSITRIIIRL